MDRWPGCCSVAEWCEVRWSPGRRGLWALASLLPGLPGLARLLEASAGRPGVSPEEPRDARLDLATTPPPHPTTWSRRSEPRFCNQWFRYHGTDDHRTYSDTKLQVVAGMEVDGGPVLTEEEIECLKERKWWCFLLSSIFTFIMGIFSVLIVRALASLCCRKVIFPEIQSHDPASDALHNFRWTLKVCRKYWIWNLSIPVLGWLWCNFLESTKFKYSYRHPSCLDALKAERLKGPPQTIQRTIDIFPFVNPGIFVWYPNRVSGNICWYMGDHHYHINTPWQHPLM